MQHHRAARLIPLLSAGMVRRGLPRPRIGSGVSSGREGEGKMRWKAGAALALLLLPASGCSSGGDVCTCPKPVAYDDMTLRKIEKAREKLPRDNILQKVLVDYENERDDLRFCR